ncbi:PREDICTED: uncharacterized protein LOC105365145 [Ceratosolen solmsi marchali]|uniref:Uncharacterized protein LOC105365145 n=1 Tax=Ceratosolen solmsi marchali TaxID=326594 RepID=A0AAJ7DYX3_9HYME|nr:PREDICTED: uncharacterized protein LOC105365145 [Ceratosolen solmsi marchali]
MGTEKSVSSDTLESLNLSSLQIDDNHTKKSSEINSTNVNLNKIQKCICHQHAFGMKFIPCSMINFDTNHLSSCFCEQAQLHGEYIEKSIENENTKNKWQHFNYKWPRQSFGKKKDMKKLYDVRAKNGKNYHNEKPLTCCEILEGIHPKRSSGLKNVVENPIKHKSNSESGNDVAEKIEIYYFDHGNSAYYHTTDIAPILKTEKVAEKTNLKITRILAEIFGLFHLIASILTTSILQSLRFILFSFVRPLTIGVIQLIADYFIKPLLSITFNALIQPILILLYNTATSIRDCCEPLATTFGFFIKEIATLIGSFKLIEITHNYKSNSNT